MICLCSEDKEDDLPELLVTGLLTESELDDALSTEGNQ